MFNYILRRLMLLPITLFFIVLVNFVIINLAPGDPVTITEISPEGASRRDDRTVAFGSDARYLQFREFYGLVLPILWNSWPMASEDAVKADLWALIYHKNSPQAPEMLVKDYEALRVKVGDRARFTMPILIKIIASPDEAEDMRRMASRFFARGGTHQAILGSNLDEEKKAYNRKIGNDNNLLASLVITSTDTAQRTEQKMAQLVKWYQENKNIYHFEPTFGEKVKIFFIETRFAHYLERVLSLDFGTMRNDANRRVIHEVTKRFKYSLTLAILPMIITFFLCQVFGFMMAYRHAQWPDYTLNLSCLVLYAIPVFVVAPFLIEKVALNGMIPFTHILIPHSGFTSPEAIYQSLTTWQRLGDVLIHIFLPLVAILYGSLAAESRLSRTAILEVLKQDYVRTAKAKGLSPSTIMIKHVGRNAAITIVTSLTSSLGVILGGSLIVETLFQIDGFGKFFYDAIINRDYNVIMFSALAGSFLSLVGYLLADIAYTILDPRLTLE